MVQQRIYTIKEYQTLRIPRGELAESEGERLWRSFRNKIELIPPNFKNNYDWEITSLGWVGFLPLSETVGFSLMPKVPILNLLNMWEYAYDYKFEFPKGDFKSDSLQDFYSQLANILANRILERAHKGYYRTYLDRHDQLPYIRGQLDMRRMIVQPWQPRPRCNFHELTADIEDNQILAWTLYVILHSHFCREDIQQTLVKSFHSIKHLVSLRSFNPQECTSRLYNRLNEDYVPMHALSHFFLANCGPTYQVGKQTMLPFLVDMAGLFERFVAAWLKKNLPPQFYLKVQTKLLLDSSWSFIPDLMICDRATNQARWILDTKYKNPSSPSNEDISQVSFYTQLTNAPEAILVYPSKLNQDIEITINGVQIRSLSFSLENDLELSGHQFLEKAGIVA